MIASPGSSLSFSPVVSRLLALALLGLIALATIVLLVDPAVSAWLDARASIDDTLDKLAQVDAQAARLPALERERAALVARLGHDSGFLQTPSVALSAAQLQATIKDVVDRHGGILESTEILPRNSDDTPFPRLTARVDLDASIESLRQIWSALETASPSLFVDNFAIEGQQRPPRMPGGHPLITLDIRFDVSVYLKSNGS